MFIRSIPNLLFSVVLAFSLISSATVPTVNTNNISCGSSSSICEVEYFSPTILMGNLYYYNQLNDSEKRLYDDLINSTDKFLNGEDITLTLCTYDAEHKKGYLEYFYFVKRVIKAYTYDNPEAVVWFENYNRTYYIANSKDYVYMKLTPKTAVEATSSLNSENIEKELALLQIKAKEFVNTLTGTDAEKVTQINNWLVNNVSYDMSISFPDRDNIYGPVMKGKAICSGYSYAFKYMADLAGLNAIYVTGKAYDPEISDFMPHAWNLVFIDNAWLLVDVTFSCALGTKYLLSSPIDNVHFPDTSYKFTYPKN